MDDNDDNGGGGGGGVPPFLYTDLGFEEHNDIIFCETWHHLLF